MMREPPGENQDPRAEAEDITQVLFNRDVPRLREGLFVGDVRHEIDEFERDVESIKRWGPRRDEDSFPVVRSQESHIPVAIRDASGRYPLNPGVRLSTDIELVPQEVARQYLRDAVRNFLTVRIRSVIQYFRPAAEERGRAFLFNMPSVTLSVASGPVVGFHVDVATITPNVRIHCSLKIRRSWSYFGFYHGKPVIGGLMGGLYEFGVDGAGHGSIQADPASFDIPYQTLSPRLTL
ncbi:MAG: hypothetical protein RB191_14550 [Terriglobia bacterium]|nr:hypothetical protein [Terriglobia bacterium]